ncbi:ATP-binding cassette domain-containing protein [Luteimonas sp. gir]|uniref:ABC transporter ATP-binding protein n=1 Tax=Luteimonas sp. gir TaxID=3127960 RepID=UPI003075CF29
MNTPAAQTPPLLDLHDATVVRDGRTVLHALRLRIPAGRHTAILGANGCGKSTLVQLLTRELHPLAHADGTPPVRVFGARLGDVTQLRARLGIVTGRIHQDLLSLPALRVEDAVVAAAYGSIAPVASARVDAALRSAACDALAAMAATHLAGRRYAALSAGEARRVLIARALVHRPEALLLDEPSTGLDVVARAQLLERLRTLAHGGTTLVLVTHHAEELLPEIEHVVLLREGRILAEGPRETMLTDAWLSRTFGAPLRLGCDAAGAPTLQVVQGG